MILLITASIGSVFGAVITEKAIVAHKTRTQLSATMPTLKRLDILTATHMEGLVYI